jgi:hypothetical protein
MTKTVSKPIKYKRMLPPREGLVLIATPLATHHARLIARARANGHAHCRKPSETIGQPSDMALAEHYGALAEIVVLDELFRAGLTPQGYQLIADRAPIGPDFTLEGVSYQVKSVPAGKMFLCINEAQRTDPQHTSDYILPVVFTTPMAARVLRPIPFAQVGTWELRKGHSEYRSVDISNLPVLKSLHDLTRK